MPLSVVVLCRSDRPNLRSTCSFHGSLTSATKAKPCSFLVFDRGSFYPFIYGVS